MSARWAPRAAIVLAMAGALSACAPTLFVPPAGPGAPAPDAAAAWTEATKACRGVTSYVGTLHVSGRINGDRIPTTITVLTGAAPHGLRLEAVAANRNIFTMAGTASDATLYLEDSHQFAKGTPEELTEALIGVRLGPARWLALVTGCVATPPDFVSGVRYGQDLAVTTASAQVFLLRSQNVWHPHDALFDKLDVTYEKFTADVSPFPAQWRIRSQAGRTPSVDLAIRSEEITVGQPLDPSKAFTVSIPASATQMTIDELRESGPLRKKG